MFLGSLHWPSQGRKREKPFVLITVNRHIFHFRIIFKPCWQQKSAHKSATLLTCELHWIPRLSIKCFVSAIPNIISKCNLTSNVFAFKIPPPLMISAFSGHSQTLHDPNCNSVPSSCRSVLSCRNPHTLPLHSASPHFFQEWGTAPSPV